MNTQQIQREILRSIIGKETKKKLQNLTKIITFSERFFIYKNAILFRVKESLSETYRRTLILIININDNLDELVINFINSSQFYSFDLFEICNEFPAFLKKIYFKNNFEFISDLAKLELLSAKAFHEKKYSSLKISDLSVVFNLPDKQISLPVQASVRLIKSKWDLVKICNFIDENIYQIDLKSIQQQSGNYYFIVFLLEKIVKVEKISIQEFIFISSLKKYQLFSIACKNIEYYCNKENIPLVQEYIPNLIFKWISKGIFLSKEG